MSPVVLLSLGLPLRNEGWVETKSTNVCNLEAIENMLIIHVFILEGLKANVLHLLY